MENTDTLVQQVLDLNVQTLETADQCAEQLKVAAGEANKHAAAAVGYGQMAIRYAIKAGEIMNRAKDILPHGEFLPWLHKQLDVVQVGQASAYKWMKMANLHNGRNLLDNPNIKTITDAYRATGILPEPEPKQVGGETEDKPKLPWSPLKFSTRVEHWTKEQAMDFIYEFDRAAQFVRALKVEFGL
jgi:hypothetical protein